MDDKEDIIKVKMPFVSIGFTEMLFLLFLTLKLTNVIDWSWWWVFAPFWIPCSFAIFLLILGLICCAVSAIADWKK